MAVNDDELHRLEYHQKQWRAPFSVLPALSHEWYM
jgi:hypothetical protein